MKQTIKSIEYKTIQNHITGKIIFLAIYVTCPLRFDILGIEIH